MKRSSDRILTTHMGSLPQSPALHARLIAHTEGNAEDADLEGDIRKAVADCVRAQAAAGISVINDGEQGKSSWAAYVKDRLDGLSGENIPRPVSRDAADFPDYYSPQRTGGTGLAVAA